MARQAKQTLDDDDLFAIGADELDEVLKGLPSDDSIIFLYRVNPNGRAAYIAEFNPQEFSLEAIKNSYGGGKFKYVAKGNGIVRKGTVEVDGPPITGGNPKVGYKKYDEHGRLIFAKPDDPAAIAYGPDARQTPIAKLANGEVSIALLLDEIRRLRDEIKQPQQSPETIKKSFLEEMMIFKQLFSNEKSPSEDLSKNVIDLIKQGIEVGQMAEGGGSPWMMILDKVLPTVQEAIQALNRQQRPIPRPVQAPVPNAIVGPPISEAPLTGFESIADKLRAYLPTFLSAASANSDPDILVDLAAPQIPEKDKATVISWLESESCFSDLCSLHPLIQGQAAWWEDFRSGLLSALIAKEEKSGHDVAE